MKFALAFLAAAAAGAAAAAAAHRCRPAAIFSFVNFLVRVNQAPLNSSEWLKMIDGMVLSDAAARRFF